MRVFVRWLAGVAQLINLRFVFCQQAVTLTDTISWSHPQHFHATNTRYTGQMTQAEIENEIREYFSKHGKVLITSRPDGMSFDAYKYIMRKQNEAMKQYKKGKLVHVSKSVSIDPNTGKIVRTQTFKQYKRPSK